MPIKNSHIPERLCGSAGAKAFPLAAGDCGTGVCECVSAGIASIAASVVIHHVAFCRLHILKILSWLDRLREKSLILPFRAERGNSPGFAAVKRRRDSSLR